MSKKTTETSSKKLKRERLDEDLFQILKDHLLGVGRGILRARLEDLCNDKHQKGKDALTLYHEARISQENAQKLTAILRCNPKKTFKEPDTLFDWIKILSQHNDGHRHLEDFHNLIKQVKPQKSFTIPLFLTTLATACGSVFLYLMPKNLRALERLAEKTLPIVTDFLEKTFSVLKNIPLVLVIYTIFCIPNQAFHSIFYDSFRSNEKRFQRWLNGTLPAVLSLIAYALCYAAKGVFTPTAVGFFIASSLVGVCNSVFNFYQLIPIAKAPAPTESLYVQLDYIRQKERRNRTVNTVGVNLTASVFVSICVTLWSILPPSFLVMIASIAFINLAGFTQSAALNRIHTKGAESLQKKLHEQCRNTAPPPCTQNIPSKEQALQAINKEIKAIKESVTRLEQQPHTYVFFKPRPNETEAEPTTLRRTQSLPNLNFGQ